MIREDLIERIEAIENRIADVGELDEHLGEKGEGEGLDDRGRA
jgi:hypothetical protein